MPLPPKVHLYQIEPLPATSSLPPQTNHNGEFLRTDGTDPRWSTIDNAIIGATGPELITGTTIRANDRFFGPIGSHTERYTGDFTTMTAQMSTNGPILGPELLVSGLTCTFTGGEGWSPAEYTISVELVNSATYLITWNQFASNSESAEIIPWLGSTSGYAFSYYGKGSQLSGYETVMTSDDESGPNTLRFECRELQTALPDIWGNGYVDLSAFSCRQIISTIPACEIEYSEDLHDRTETRVTGNPVIITNEGNYRPNTLSSIGYGDNSLQINHHDNDGGLRQNMDSSAPGESSGSELVAVGTSALQCNTIGFSNTAIGSAALQLNTSGFENCAVGSHSMEWVQTGYQNTSVGTWSMNSSVTGYKNNAFGYMAMASASKGYNNCAFGNDALKSIDIGYGNCAFGNNALTGVIGHSNIGIGYNAGSGMLEGVGNVVIGSNNGATLNGSDNQVIISDGSSNIKIAFDNIGGMYNANFRHYTEAFARYDITTAGFTVDCSTFNTHYISLMTTVTSLSFIGVPQTGESAFTLTLIFNDPAPYSVVWPASIRWKGAVVPELSTSGGSLDIIVLTTYDNGDSWIGTSSLGYAQGG